MNQPSKETLSPTPIPVNVDPTPGELAEAMTAGGTWPAILVEHMGARWVSVNDVNAIFAWKTAPGIARARTRELAVRHDIAAVETDQFTGAGYDVVLPLGDALALFEGHLSFVTEERLRYFPTSQRLDLRPRREPVETAFHRNLARALKSKDAEIARLTAIVERFPVECRVADPTDAQLVAMAAALLGKVKGEWHGFHLKHMRRVLDAAALTMSEFGDTSWTEDEVTP